MKLALQLFLSLAVVVSSCGLAAGSGNQFIAIAYHDVVDTREELASDGVTIDHLINQFEWLLANEYHPVSVDELIAAGQGKQDLPEKAVLLCWDDGYTSFYDKVFPLLKAYNFPAVLALVGSWLEPEPPATVAYGDNHIPRTRFLSWQQVKELSESGLVEIASHSYNLHNAVLADAAGDKLPATITHIYDPETQRYENDDEHYQRILTDLHKNNALLKHHLGVAPRIMVWPFGRYNNAALRAAQQAGMPITLNLNPVPGNVDNLQEIGRIYPTLNPGPAAYRGYLNLDIAPPIRHFFKVETNELLDESGSREANFSAFLDRLVEIKPDMVTFEPTMRAENKISSLFINDSFPIEQDRLIRLTWHTSRTGGTGTFLWLPSYLFTPDPNADRIVPSDLFSQLGKFGFSEGILVDCPRLTNELIAASSAAAIQEKPDTFWNPAKRRMARKNWPTDIEQPFIAAALSKLEAFQYWQPFVEVGLVLPAALLPELDTTTTSFLLHYFDFLLIDARTYKGRVLERTLQTSLAQLHATGLLPKISLMIKHDGPEKDLTDQLAELPYHNIMNWGYEYDNFLLRQPSTINIRPLMTKSTYPFR